MNVSTTAGRMESRARVKPGSSAQKGPGIFPGPFCELWRVLAAWGIVAPIRIAVVVHVRAEPALDRALTPMALRRVFELFARGVGYGARARACHGAGDAADHSADRAANR